MKKMIGKNKKKIALAILAILAIGWCISDRPLSEAYIKSRVVRLSSKGGMCSGEQVHALSGKDYILSAAHCRVLIDADGNFNVSTEDGRQMQRHIIAEDTRSDLILIEGIPNMRGLDIALQSKRFDHIRTFTHGSNLDTYKTEGEVIQDRELILPISLVTSDEEMNACQAMSKQKFEIFSTPVGPIAVCMLDIIETASTAQIVPGSSGGPAVNDAGELMGVASITDGHFGYFVRLLDIRGFLSNY